MLDRGTREEGETRNPISVGSILRGWNERNDDSFSGDFISGFLHPLSVLFYPFVPAISPRFIVFSKVKIDILLFKFNPIPSVSVRNVRHGFRTHFFFLPGWYFNLYLSYNHYKN